MPMRSRTSPDSDIKAVLDEIEQVVNGYVPAGAPLGWPRVAAAVREAVVAAAPHISYGAGELMGVLTRLALFADAEGQPVQAAVWLSREYIERFVTVGCADVGRATRANYRSKLLRLRECLLGGDCRTGTPAKLPGAPASRPYTAAEQAALWAWANGQPTAGLQHGLKTLLALGFGSGLESHEVIPLRTTDVRTGPTSNPIAGSAVLDTGVDTAVGAAADQVMVTVRGRRARLVVCRRAWERVLADQAEHALRIGGEPGGYLFRANAAVRGGNIVTNFLARTHAAPGVPPLKTARLRATWLVGLIEAGVPLTVIVSAAGLDTLHSLTRLLPFVRSTDPGQAATLLRGSP